jgi:nucleotide-binding universal stress UspA family protein
MPAPGGPSLPKPEKRAMARGDLREAIEHVDRELLASGWVIGGPPARGILAVADDIGADLIVTGSRSRGPITRAILGSDSTPRGGSRSRRAFFRNGMTRCSS